MHVNEQRVGPGEEGDPVDLLTRRDVDPDEEAEDGLASAGDDDSNPSED